MIGILKQVEGGRTVAEVCWEAGIIDSDVLQVEAEAWRDGGIRHLADAMGSGTGKKSDLLGLKE